MNIPMDVNQPETDLNQPPQLLPNEILYEIVRKSDKSHFIRTALTFATTCRATNRIGFTNRPLQVEQYKPTRQIILTEVNIAVVHVSETVIWVYYQSSDCYIWLYRASGSPRVIVYFGDEIDLDIGDFNGCRYTVKFCSNASFRDLVHELGRTPDIYPGRKRRMGTSQKMFWAICKLYIPRFIVNYIYHQVQEMEQIVRHRS